MIVLAPPFSSLTLLEIKKGLFHKDCAPFSLNCEAWSTKTNKEGQFKKSGHSNVFHSTLFIVFAVVVLFYSTGILIVNLFVMCI